MTKKKSMAMLPLILIVFFFLFNSQNYIKLENMNIVVFLNIVFYLISLGTSLYFNQSKAFLMLSFTALMQVVVLKAGIVAVNPMILKDLLLTVTLLNMGLILLSTEKGVFSSEGKWSYTLFILEYSVISFYLYLMQNQIFKVLYNVIYKDVRYVDIKLGVVFLAAMVLIVTHGILRRDSGSYFYLLMIFMLLSLKYKDYELNYSYISFTTILILLFVTVIKKSYQMAYYDELTQIPGRRALNEALLTLNKKYSIAMLDIDHFKKFNDTYGHKTGDDVLRLVASIIKDVKYGKAYRYGGEEFVIIFKGRESEDVVDILEELRQKIATRPFYFRSKDREEKSEKDRGSLEKEAKKLYVTVSMGLANRCEEFQSPEDVIKAGDEALYEAKKAGRNCVCHY